MIKVNLVPWKERHLWTLPWSQRPAAAWHWSVGQLCKTPLCLPLAGGDHTNHDPVMDFRRMWLTLEKQIFHQRQTLLELSSCQSSTSELPVWFVSSLEFCAYWLLFKFWLLCLRFANNQTSWSLHIADVQEGLGYPGHAECNPIIPHAKWWISHHLEFWKILNHLPFIYLKHDIIDHLPPQGTWKLQQAWATSQDWQTLSCV